MTTHDNDFIAGISNLAKAANIDLGIQGEDTAQAQVFPMVDLNKSLIELAAELGNLLRSEGLYRFTGKFIIINENDPKNLTEEVCPKTFVSWIQQYCKTHSGYRKGEDGEKGPPKWCDITESKASIVLKCRQFVDLIPEITNLIPARLPVLNAEGQPELLEKGYNHTEKTYILASAPDIDESWCIDQAYNYYHLLQLPMGRRWPQHRRAPQLHGGDVLPDDVFQCHHHPPLPVHCEPRRLWQILAGPLSPRATLSHELLTL